MTAIAWYVLAAVVTVPIFIVFLIEAFGWWSE